jgi:hypothetical protein
VSSERIEPSPAPHVDQMPPEKVFELLQQMEQEDQEKKKKSPPKKGLRPW